MARLRFAAALFVLVMGGAASAADSPLTAFRDDTDVLIRIKAPKATVDKAASLVDAIQPGFGPMVRQNAAALGALISNPSLSGVDQTKDWYIAIRTNGQEQPSVIFGIPVTNAQAAQGGLSDGLVAKAHGEWLYYSQDADALPATGSVPSSISGTMKGEPTTVFDKGDVAVFVNLANLINQYQAELDKGLAEAQENLDQIPQQPGTNPELIKKVAGTFFEYLRQGLKDSKQLTIALNVGAEGITCEDYLSFSEGSESSKFISTFKTSDMAALNKLPSDAVVLYGASGDMQKVLELSYGLAELSPGQTPEQQAAMKQFMTDSAKLKFGAMIGGFSLAKSDAGLVKVTSVLEVSPAREYRELTNKMMSALGTVDTPQLKQETKLQADAESYGSLKADLVTVKQEFNEEADPTGTGRAMVQTLFGSEGIQTRIIYQADRFISTMGGGREQMVQTLKALDSKTDDAAVAKFRKPLINSSNFLVLVDVPGLIVQGMRAASGTPGLPINIQPEMLDSLKFDKSFMGLAAAVETDGLRVKTSIPTEQLRSIFGLVMFAQQMQAQQN